MPNILVVENDPDSSQGLAGFLKGNLNGSRQWQILEAGNGKSALKTLYNNNVHLVITHINSSAVSNGGLLHEISDNEILQDIPVMAISDKKEDEKEILNLGAVDFFLAPIKDYDAFTTKVKNHASRNIRTINFRKAAEFVALLNDLENVKETMGDSLTDFGRQMLSSPVCVMTKDEGLKWRLHLAHNVPSDAQSLFENSESFETSFLEVLSSERKGISVANVKNHGLADRAMETIIKRIGAKSILALPLLSDKRVASCIIFFFETRRSFSDRDMENLLPTVPNMVHAIENLKKIDDLRSEIFAAWKIGATGLRKLGLYPGEVCEGCREKCDDCDTLAGHGFDSVEGVVGFTKAMLDRLLDLSNKVDRQKEFLEREVRGRTEQFLKEIEERKRVEKGLEQSRNELEKKVLKYSSDLVSANELYETEVARRLKAESAVKKNEDRIRRKTAELKSTNKSLLKEISEREKAEKAVRETHTETERHLAAISSIFISVDAKGNVTRWNEAATNTLGIEAKEIVGRPFIKSDIKWDWDVINSGFNSCRLDSKACRIENVHYTRPSGEPGFLALTLSPIDLDRSVKKGKFGFIILGSDITLRKLYQDQLRLADTVYQNTIEGIMVTDSDGIIHSVNPAFTEITGYLATEVIGKKSKILKSDKHDDLFFEGMWNSLLKTGQWVGEVWNKRKNGETYPQWLTIVSIKDDEGNTAQYLSVLRDITEIKLAEERLRKHEEILMQSEKMAGIGELASGVAHELNQPLNHINITCQILVKMLQRDFFEKGAMLDEILIIVDNVQRAVEIIRTMRDFARKDSGVNSAIDVRIAIKNSIKMFGSQLKTHDIKLTFDAPEKQVLAMGSLNKLSQVIVNMITNARDSLISCDDKLPKEIAISVMEEAGHVLIRVKDNGQGIPEKIRKDIFNPFFTTKESGVGTGLGLSVSYKIIQEFGGNLGVEWSQANEGTCMKITLNKQSGK